MTTLAPAPPLASLRDEGAKVVLFLDFDGVFNTFFRNGTPPKAYYRMDRRERHPNPHYRPAVGRSRVPKHLREPKSYEFWWSSLLLEALNELTQDPRVQVVWLTTWREHMAAVGERLELSFARSPVYLPWDDYPLEHFGHLGKVLSARDYFTTGNEELSFVWIDDMVADESYLRQSGFFSADELSLGLEPALSAGALTADRLKLLAPLEKFGVSPQEWASVRAFVDPLLP